MADDKRYFKPAAGRSVPRQDGTLCPDEGDYWPDDRYTRRRIKDGDLVKADPPAQAAKPATGTDTGAEKTDPPKPVTTPAPEAGDDAGDEKTDPPKPVTTLATDNEAGEIKMATAKRNAK